VIFATVIIQYLIVAKLVSPSN